MEIRDRPTLVLHAGDGFCTRPGTPHDALDPGPDTGVVPSTRPVDVDGPSSAEATVP